jgi:hypothetical protein
MSDVLLALRDVLPANPWPAALWFLSAVGLGGLLVYAWQRLFGSS